MPIQYRCRCGQEVVLRTRESVYLIAGAAVLFTLINTVLLVVVWNRLGDLDSPTTPRASELASGPPGPADESTVADAPSNSRPATNSGDANTSGTDGSSRDPRVGSPSDDGAAEGLPDETESPPWAPAIVGNDGARAKLPLRTTDDLVPADEVPPSDDGGSASTDVASSGSGSGDVSQVTPPQSSVTVRRPQDVDGLMLWLALEALPADPAERTAVLVAGVAWGTGFVRELAERRLSEESGPWGNSLREWWAAQAIARGSGSGGARRPRAQQLDLPAELGNAISKPWTSLGSLLAERGLDEDRSWAARVRLALGDPTDRVLLVDLSQSMEVEVAQLADHLRAMLPLLDRPGGGQWGWIGFRDEVVDALELTSDVDEFLDSLPKWRCEGGGDVPEGVDRAVFEALKFGRFEWTPKLGRRLLLVGDAPPPYDRIGSVVSLMSAARQSPDGYGLDAVGVVREPEFARLPAFRDLAEAGGGRAVLLDPDEPLGPPVWKLVVGAAAPDWRGTIAPARGG